MSGFRLNFPSALCAGWAGLFAALSLAVTAHSKPHASKPRRSSDATAEAMALLKANCFACHNEEKKKAGLILTSHHGLLQGSENGPVVVAGKPDSSLLIKVLAPDHDPHMPPKKQLNPGQIGLLRGWIKKGAKWDEAAVNEAPFVVRSVSPKMLPSAYHPVLAMALSPDESKLAVGCANRVLIYQASPTNFPMLGRAQIHPEAVQSLAWSPDGKLLASGAFRRVVIWNAESLVPVKEISEKLLGRITALEFSPDGQRLVLADSAPAETGILHLLQTSTGALVRSWQAHSDTIFDLAVSADGQRLATAGGDKLVKIWDLEKGKETARFEGHTLQVLAVAFNTNATQLATGGADKQLRVWDVQTRERIITLGNHAAAITAVAWLAEAQAVIAANELGAIYRYTELKIHSGAQSSESATEKLLGTAGEALYCVSASAKGDLITAGAHDGQVRIWDAAGKLIGRIAAHENERNGTVAASQ